jgi:hypothetical protein
MTSTVTEIGSAVERAQKWLLKVDAEAVQGSAIPVSLLLHTTLGLWLCEAAFGIGDARPNVVDISTRLGQMERNGDLDLARCDSHLLLYCAAILRGYGESIPTLDAYVDMSAKAIAEHQDGSALEASELFPARFMLWRQGLVPEPVAPIFQPTGMPEEGLLFADSLISGTIAKAVGASTTFGRLNNTAGSEGLEAVTHALPIWMLAALRRNHIEEGARLLRTMAYLGLRETAAYDQGISFLLMQQHPEGYFGFWAKVVDEIRLKSPDFAERESLHLPVTTACLWTLAEAADPGFLLYERVPVPTDM